MKLIKINTETGMFIEDVIVKEIPTVTLEDEEGNLTLIPDPQYIQTPCQGGFYRPKWDGEKWVEGLSQTEIDAIVNVPVEPTLEDRISTTETKVVTLEQTVDILFGGGIV